MIRPGVYIHNQSDFEYIYATCFACDSKYIKSTVSEEKRIKRHTILLVEAYFSAYFSVFTFEHISGGRKKYCNRPKRSKIVVPKLDSLHFKARVTQKVCLC